MDKIKEFLPDGNVVDENDDVRSRHDFPRDDYPEPTPEYYEAQAAIQSIDLYEASLALKALAAKGSSNSEVRKRGGVKACRQAAHDRLIEARRVYVKGLGFIADKPDGSDSAEQDSYDAGVKAWSYFRDTVLQDIQARTDLKGAAQATVRLFQFE